MSEPCHPCGGQVRTWKGPERTGPRASDWVRGHSGDGGSSPHLLELVHSLLQLYPHSVLLFPPGRHGGQGESLGAGSCPAPPLQLPAPCARHPFHSGLSLSSSAALGVQEPWAGPAGGPRVASCNCRVAPCFLAHQLSSRNVRAAPQEPYLRATAAPVPLGPWLSQLPGWPPPLSCPHQTPRPAGPAPHIWGPRSSLLPPARSSPGLLQPAALPLVVPFHCGEAAAGHTPQQQGWSRAW